MKFNKFALLVLFVSCFSVGSHASDQAKKGAVNSVPGKSHITWGYKEKPPTFDKVFSETLRDLYKQKISSMTDDGEGKESFIAMSCISFSYYERADFNNPNAKVWLAQVEWEDDSEVKSKKITIKAATRELAASYSTCRVWSEEKLKFKQIKGAYVEEVNSKKGE